MLFFPQSFRGRLRAFQAHVMSSAWMILAQSRPCHTDIQTCDSLHEHAIHSIYFDLDVKVVVMGMHNDTARE